MLSTVGLELTNFINPNLSWKKVTKGFRSTTRRSRKQTARSLNMVAKLGHKNPRRDGGSSISESEKLGVSVLGRRFTDNPEHVPIKKRRFLVHSPSPSPLVPNSGYKKLLLFNGQTATPNLKEVVSKHLLDCKYGSDSLELFPNWRIGAFDGSAVINSARGVNDRVTRGKNTEVAKGQLYYTDDFSGIELLAAAACSYSIGDDAENSKDAPVVEESSTREGLNSSTLDVPLRNSEHACNANGSLNQEDSHVSSKQPNEDVGTVKKSVASKDDRLHWDLNTVMGAWGETEPLEPPSSTGEVEVEGECIPQESFKCYADNTCISKVSSPSDNCRNSNVSQDDSGYLVGVGNITELHEDCDSPFEDGELRESVMYSCEENEGEDMEIECVDYESNYQDDSDAADYPTSSEKVNAGGGVPIVGMESSLVGDIVESGLSKSSSVKTMNAQMKREYTGNDGVNVEEVRKKGLNKRYNLDVRQDSNASGDNDSARSRASDCGDDFDIKSSHAGEVGSKVSQGKLWSQIEGPPFYILDGKGSVFVQRGRSFICGKSMGRGRFSLRVCHRNEGDDHLIDSSMGYWGSRDCYAANYCGSEEYVGYKRPRSSNSDYVAKTRRLNGHDVRHLNHSSRSMCRPQVRRRSPVERDDGSGLRRGIPSVRAIGFDRSWASSGICRQSFRQGPRREYHGSGHDDVQPSSVSMQQYLARRELSPSPSYSRGAYISRPRRKSRSRSKTRSRPAWHLRKEQSFIRRHGRSPDFRSNARMDRMRRPFQKCCFAADYEEDFISPPRGHFSLEHNSRCISDRNCEDERFRDRRSPVRMVRQRQRFDSASFAPRRSKPDDNRRTILHSGRFPLVVRAQKFEDGEHDRAKHDKRYEPIQRVRRNDIDGVGRRSRYDAKDCFEVGMPHNDDECSRGTDRRDISSCAKEEKPFRYNHGTKEWRAPSRYDNDFKERAPIRYSTDRMWPNALSSGLRDPDGEALLARA